MKVAQNKIICILMYKCLGKWLILLAKTVTETKIMLSPEITKKLDKSHETIVLKTPESSNKSLNSRLGKQMGFVSGLLHCEGSQATAQEEGCRQSSEVSLRAEDRAEGLGRLRWLEFPQQGTGEKSALQNCSKYSSSYVSSTVLTRESMWELPETGERTIH